MRRKAIIDDSICRAFAPAIFPDGVERGVDAIVQALSVASAWRFEWEHVAAAVLLLGAAGVILFTIFRGLFRAARRRDPNATETDSLFWYWPTTTSTSNNAASATPTSSFDSGGFSGGGGDSGGGGASGSW